MLDNGVAQKFSTHFVRAVGAPDVPDRIRLWGCGCRFFKNLVSTPMRALPGFLPGIFFASRWHRPRRSGLGDREGEFRGRVLYSGHGGRAHRGLSEDGGRDLHLGRRARASCDSRFAWLSRTHESR
jgi:tartrate dehydrogenase/decarboxylase/D-malate dehydrogenase